MASETERPEQRGDKGENMSRFAAHGQGKPSRADERMWAGGASKTESQQMQSPSCEMRGLSKAREGSHHRAWLFRRIVVIMSSQAR